MELESTREWRIQQALEAIHRGDSVAKARDDYGIPEGYLQPRKSISSVGFFSRRGAAARLATSNCGIW